MIAWLIQSLETRGWSQRELARRASISQSSVSDVLSQKRLPTWDFCAAIAQERRRRNRRPYHRKGGGPLSGIAYCDRCGEPMKVERHRYHHNTVYTSMVCSTHRKKSLTGISCHHNSVPEHKLITALSGFIAQLVDRETLNAALEELEQSEDRADLVASIKAARDTAASLERQRERLALAAGKMDVDIYRQTDDGIRARLEAARAQLTELERTLDTLPDQAVRRAALEELVSTFPLLVEHVEPAEISAALQDAGIRIYIEDNAVQRIVIV